MGELFSITLVSGVMLLCMYLPYKLLLAGERQHRFNRAVIICMYLVAVTVPLLPRISFPVGGTASEAATTAVGNITIGPLTGGILATHTPLWTRVVLWIYIVGVAVTLLKFLWSYLRLMHIIRQGHKEKREGYTLVIADDAALSPFSWRKYVVVGDSKDADERSAVMVHELRHLAAGHSTDIFIAQLYAILVWYNPVSWLMIDELKTVHEYEADEAVIDSGANLKEYQMLLIKKTAGARLPSLANSLNHSKLQKRVTMMYQSKSKLAGKFSTLALLPALAIGMAVVSIPTVASVISDASEATLMESNHKVSKNSDNAEMTAVLAAPVADAVSSGETETSERMDANTEIPDPVVSENAVEDPVEAELPAEKERGEVYVAVEKQAEFPGGIQALMHWLSMNVRYPEDAMKNDAQGRVIVKFVVNPDGSISDPTVLKSVEPSLDQEAVRVVMAMPKWEAAENQGQKVASYFNIPISFKLTPSEPNDSTATTKP